MLISTGLFKNNRHAQHAGRLLLALVGHLSISLLPGMARAQTVTYGAPIVITQGGTYTGNYQSLASGTPCVRIATTAPVILDGCQLSGAGNLIEAGTGASLTVRNCQGQGLVPSVDNQAPGRFVSVYRPQRLVIEHNYFRQTSGIVVDRWGGTGQAGQVLQVRYNQARNLDGRWRNGGGRTICSFLLLNTVSGLAGVDIGYNEVVNQPDQSLVEDNINLYNSSGTAASPLRVHDNFVRGAYPFPATAAGFTGSGLTTDGNASTLGEAAGYIEADHNQFVSTGNAALNLAAGHDVYYHDNRAVTSGWLPDGRRFNAGWAGLGVFNYYNQPASVYFNNRMENNTVGYVKWGGTTPYADRQDLSPGACGPCTGTSSLPNPITPATEEAEFTRWQQKLLQAGISVGPTGTTVVAAPTVGTVLNPGFEADGAAMQAPTGWLTQAGTGTYDNADYTEAYGGAHTGTYHGTHYRPEAYEVYTYQTITGLTNGTYALRAWVKNSGGQSQVQLRARNYGGTALSLPISAGSAWTQLTLPNIVVSNGQCEIGFYSQAGAGQWLYFDDVELVATAPVVVVPPTVALAAPAGAVLGTAVALSATAADADGTVSKVEFFQGSTKLGEALAAPYQLSWTPAAAGSYALTAQATDNGGNTTTSTAVTVTVTAPIIIVPVGVAGTVANPGFEADNAAVPAPTGWQTQALTSGSENADYTETYGGAHAGTYHGTHWSTSAYEVYTYQTITGLPNGTYKLRVWVKNSGGQAIAQVRARNYGGTALSLPISGSISSWTLVELPGISVSNGQCEIGFYSQASSQQWLYFDDVELVATAPVVVVPPTVALAAPAGAVLGTAVALSATAADADGTVSKVEFFQGSTKLGEVLAAPYQLSWTPAAAGSYALTAQATDNGGNTTTSTAVTVTVTAPIIIVPVGVAGTVANPGFEADNAAVPAPTGWQTQALTSGSENADYTETYGGAHAGTYHGTHWSTSAYEVYTYQTITGLPNGTYKLRAWVKCGGGQSQVQLRARNYGGAALSLPVPGGLYSWTLIELPNIAVSNGQCELGFYSQASSGQWLYFDDVELVVSTPSPVNPGFEADNAAVPAPTGWQTQALTSGSENADYTETYGGAHAGTYHGTHWSTSAYEVYTYQTITGLPNGTYKLRAWVKCGGGQSQVQLRARNYGGAALSLPVPGGLYSWTLIELPNIAVSNGQCELGFYSQASSGQWLYFDDVELTMQATAARGVAATPATTATTVQAKPALYPNPASDQVVVVASFAQAVSVTLVVSNLQGVAVAKYQRLATSGDNQFVIDTAVLPAGLYNVQLQSREATTMQRLEVKH